METSMQKISNFIQELIPPLTGKVSILSVVHDEKYLLTLHRTDQPIALGALLVKDTVFTGKQFLGLFEGCFPKTANNKM